MDRENIFTEFKKATQMEKFNFAASLVTVSGVSIFTILSGIKKINTVMLGFYLIFWALILLIVSIIIGLYYLLILATKKDYPILIFWVSTFILTMIAVGFILLIVSGAWEFISNFN